MAISWAFLRIIRTCQETTDNRTHFAEAWTVHDEFVRYGGALSSLYSSLQESFGRKGGPTGLDFWPSHLSFIAAVDALQCEHTQGSSSRPPFVTVLVQSFLGNTNTASSRAEARPRLSNWDHHSPNLRLKKKLLTALATVPTPSHTSPGVVLQVTGKPIEFQIAD